MNFDDKVVNGKKLLRSAKPFFVDVFVCIVNDVNQILNITIHEIMLRNFSFVLWN